MIVSFQEYAEIKASIRESEEKTAVIAFGRFNPPTSGHVKLMNAMQKIAKKCNGIPMVFLSHTQDSSKNPLSYQDRINYLRYASPSNFRISETEAKTIYEVAKLLGTLLVKRLIVVAGSDRVEDYEPLKKYADKYGLDEIKIVSAGKRGIGSLENVENVSSSALRKLAADGNMNDFIKYSALSKDPNEAEKMYHKVRFGLGLGGN